jgi:hypothetical protein
MTDNIFEQYQADIEFRNRILRKIRNMARNAGLGAPRIEIDGRPQMAIDSIEKTANAFAERMRKAEPSVRFHLHNQIRFGELSDPDLEGLLTTKQKKGVLGLKVSDIIRETRSVLLEKVKRNGKWEIRTGFGEAKGEVGRDAKPKVPRRVQHWNLRQQKDLGLENVYPYTSAYLIDPIKRVRKLDSRDIRLCLNFESCDAKAALELVVFKVFVASTHAPYPAPSRGLAKQQPVIQKAKDHDRG